MKRKRYGTFTVILLLLSGFLAGTALPELFRMNTGEYAGYFSVYAMGKYKNLTVTPLRIFSYIAGIRLKTLLFLWMSTYTVLGIWFHILYGCWLAVSAGMLISLFVLRDGYEGILLFLCCLLPQWILYCVSWKRELSFLGRGRYAAPEGTGYEKTGRTGFLRRQLLIFGEMIGYCILGCAAEAFLGSWTLKIFLQYFS